MQQAHQMTKSEAIKDLVRIPGVGKSIAADLWNIGIKRVSDLKRQDPDLLYDLSNRYAGAVQDRCLLYVFKCAVYYANNEGGKMDSEKLKWWNWKDELKSKPRITQRRQRGKKRVQSKPFGAR